MPEKPNWTESFQTIADGRRPFVLRNYDTGYYQGPRNSNILAFLELNHQLLPNVEASWLCSPTWELHLCREGSQHWSLHKDFDTSGRQKLLLCGLTVTVTSRYHTMRGIYIVKVQNCQGHSCLSTIFGWTKQPSNSKTMTVVQ